MTSAQIHLNTVTRFQWNLIIRWSAYTLLDICKGKVKTVIIQIFVCVILYSFIERNCERGRRTSCLYFDGFLFVSFSFLFFFTFAHNKMCYDKYFYFDSVFLLSIKLWLHLRITDYTSIRIFHHSELTSCDINIIFLTNY